jgi:putative ABC transport system permease protein
VPGVGDLTSHRPYAKVTTLEAVRGSVNRRADGMIWGMSQLPLVTLLVTSLGVSNTVWASVRARRWGFGVLRAVGITRWGLVRLVLAEGFLIGAVACVMSLALGVMAGWCGIAMSPQTSPFGGLATPLVIPWARLAYGLGAAMLLCLIAAVWPAVATARSEPVGLLRTGRAAM